jgi:hypothetical protein
MGRSRWSALLELPRFVPRVLPVATLRGRAFVPVVAPAAIPVASPGPAALTAETRPALAVFFGAVFGAVFGAAFVPTAAELAGAARRLALLALLVFLAAEAVFVVAFGIGLLLDLTRRSCLVTDPW